MNIHGLKQKYKDIVEKLSLEQNKEKPNGYIVKYLEIKKNKISTEIKDLKKQKMHKAKRLYKKTKN